MAWKSSKAEFTVRFGTVQHRGEDGQISETENLFLKISQARTEADLKGITAPQLYKLVRKQASIREVPSFWLMWST
jgi:hypothetical protein